VTATQTQRQMFESTYSPQHAQHVVVCRELEILVVPSVHSVGPSLDPDAAKRAATLRDALNRIYAREVSA
jgi:hypothetical protein